jgi:hypothetical protein
MKTVFRMMPAPVLGAWTIIAGLTDLSTVEELLTLGYHGKLTLSSMCRCVFAWKKMLISGEKKGFDISLTPD